MTRHHPEPRSLRDHHPPIYPAKRYLDWQLTDPAGKPVDAVRAIRDDIDRRVRDLLAELVPATT